METQEDANASNSKKRSFFSFFSGNSAELDIDDIHNPPLIKDYDFKYMRQLFKGYGKEKHGDTTNDWRTQLENNIETCLCGKFHDVQKCPYMALISEQDSVWIKKRKFAYRLIFLNSVKNQFPSSYFDSFFRQYLKSDSEKPNRPLFYACKTHPCIPLNIQKYDSKPQPQLNEKYTSSMEPYSEFGAANSTNTSSLQPQPDYHVNRSKEVIQREIQQLVGKYDDTMSTFFRSEKPKNYLMNLVKDNKTDRYSIAQAIHEDFTFYENERASDYEKDLVTETMTQINKLKDLLEESKSSTRKGGRRKTRRKRCRRARKLNTRTTRNANAEKKANSRKRQR